MSLPVSEKIKRIFLKEKITPLKFIQGDNQYNFLKSQKPSRKFFKKSTALFEAEYKSKEVIVKIYIQTKNNILRFKREKYSYTTLSKNYSETSKYFPKIFLTKMHPFPLLVVEKIKYKNIGDWYKIDENITISEITNILSTLKKLHATITIPNYLAYRKTLNVHYFIKKNKKIKQTLRTFPRLDTTWKKLIKKKHTFIKIFQSLPKGFIFSDFSPSNIFINKNKIKFIDLETVSNSSIFYDIAVFYFSSIYSEKLSKKIEKAVYKLFITNRKQSFLFNYFSIWYILFNLNLTPINKKAYIQKMSSLAEKLI